MEVKLVTSVGDSTATFASMTSSCGDEVRKSPTVFVGTELGVFNKTLGPFLAMLEGVGGGGVNFSIQIFLMRRQDISGEFAGATLDGFNETSRYVGS